MRRTLRLHRETIRTLTASALARAVGGIQSDPTVAKSCPITACQFTCTRDTKVYSQCYTVICPTNTVAFDCPMG